MPQYQFDLVIIGAGAGGLSLAAGATQLGLKVALIEKGLMGGDCLNYGCVPSKSLLAAAKTYWQSLHSQNLGIHPSKIELEFTKVMEHIRVVIDKLAVHDSVERFTALGVQVFQGSAKFIAKNSIQVGEKEISGKYLVIATGSSPQIPPIPGLQTIPYLTNETIFSLHELPKHLLVIGAGPIGCELAQAFAMLGVKVSLIEAGQMLRNDDASAVDILRHQLKETGVAIYEHTTVQSVSISQDNIVLENTQADKLFSLVGSHLLIATGRKANINDLDCAKAGIELKNQHIILDKRLRTTNRHIFVIGDAVQQYQFTHIANYHAGIVLRNIAFKLPAKISDHVVPWVTFTSPEIAQVGLQEKDGDSEHITVLTCPYTHNDRAQTEGKTIGMIKVIVDKKGRILGATIVGEHAGEMILPWIIAVKEKRSLRLFTDLIIPYPSFNELSKRVAGQFYTSKLFSPKVQCLVRFLNKIWP